MPHPLARRRTSCPERTSPSETPVSEKSLRYSSQRAMEKPSFSGGRGHARLSFNQVKLGAIRTTALSSLDITTSLVKPDFLALKVDRSSLSDDAHAWQPVARPEAKSRAAIVTLVVFMRPNVDVTGETRQAALPARRRIDKQRRAGKAA